MPKAVKVQNSCDVEALKSDVASFAASIGLSCESGFNDIDFRKKDTSAAATPFKVEKHIQPPFARSNKHGLDRRRLERKNGVTSLRGRASLLLDGKEAAGCRADDAESFGKLPLIKAREFSGPWFVYAAELESRVFGKVGKSNEVKGLDEAKLLSSEKAKIAERLMEQYSQDYEASRAKSGDMRMVSMAQRSGTAVDKVAAFSCMVEDNPVANLRSLDALLAMVTSKVGKRHALNGFQALRDLFILKLLPDRKLKYLFQRPLSPLLDCEDGYSLLLFWYWEECLKLRYERFILAVEEASKDSLPILKDKALTTMVALLKSKPEQEHRLLSVLVNKFGDPVRKAAAAAAYHLTSLLSVHPNMKAVVIEEVDRFLFRPHLGLRAKCYAANFLNQIFLTKNGDGPKIAKRLVDIYFAVFKLIMTEGPEMNEKGKKDDPRSTCNPKQKLEGNLQHYFEVDAHILSALLTGVNRAFPYVASSEADDIMEAQTPILFKLVHCRNFNIGVQALLLLYQISSRNQVASDRFYRALYSKLVVPAVMNSSKSEMFLALLVKAMKSDLNLRRVSAFSKRLLQLALHLPPQYACGCLFILSEILKAKPPLWGMMLLNESFDEEIEHFDDILDESLDELCTVASVNSGALADSTNDHDVDGKSTCHIRDSSASDIVDHNPNRVQNSSIQLADQRLLENANEMIQVPLKPGGYNPQHRDPSYCNADRVGWWELAVLALHVHPSVSTMAQTLLSGSNIVYNGDPLIDLSLSAFLDKFMEKKPKPNRRADGLWYGGSHIAPTRKLDTSNHFVGAEILSLAEEEVPPEDIVFHKFYVNRMNTSKKSQKRKKMCEAEDNVIMLGSDGSENEEVDKMLGVSADMGLDVEGDYSYDDFDKIAGDGDVDLVEDLDPEAESTVLTDHDCFSGDGGSDSEGYDNNNHSVNSSLHKVKRKLRPSPFVSLKDFKQMQHSDHVKRKKCKHPKGE